MDGGPWNEITTGSMTAYLNNDGEYEIHYTYFETFAECLANNDRCSTNNPFPTIKVAFCNNGPQQCNGVFIPRVYLPVLQNDETLRFRITDAEDSSLTDVSPVISFRESVETCGNGTREGTEQCDDGSQNGQVCTAGYGQSCQYCSSSCTNVTVTGPRCGDSTTDTGNGEQCDDGSQNGQACTAEYGQTCQYCSSQCSTVTVTGPRCGDGTVDTGNGEECDDGGTTPGDGCSAQCTNEHTAACNVTSLPAPTYTAWITSGDLDGDSDTDLATLGDILPGQGGTTISVFLNNGNGTFQTHKDYTPGGVYRDIALGDFDKDGDKDVVLGINSFDQQIAVVANNGQGKFNGTPRTFSTGGGHFYHEVSVGDVNGDGDLDVFAGGLYDGGTIFVGGSGLNFSVGQELGTEGGNQYHPTLVDVDNDGDLDAIATPHGAGGTNMQVFRNNGQGVFGIPTNYVHTPMNPYTNDLLTGDVNGDGFVDLVQLPNGGGFFVWMNDTHGTFTKTVYAEILGRDGALADFTGDGVRDLMGCTYVWANYNFRRGRNDGTFAETVTIPMQTTGRGMVAADFDGDGRMDLAQAMAESEDAGRIILDVGQCVGGGGGGGGAVCGNGTREETEQCDDGSQNGQVCTAEYGQSCQYCSSSCTNVTVTGPSCGDGTTHMGNGEQCDNGNQNGQACTAEYGQTCQYCSSQCSTVTVTGPRCGDGTVDTGNGEECDDGGTTPGDGCSAQCTNEHTAACNVTSLPAPTYTAWITSGDLDGDSDTDLATLGDILPGQGGTTISVFLNNGNGTFQTHKDYTPGGVYRDIALGDFDKDGDKDVVLGINSFDQQIAVVANNGQGKFNGTPRTFSTGGGHFYHEVSVGDVNGDGDLDVFAGGLYDGGTIFVGGSGLNFSVGQELGTEGGNQYHPTLVDVDNDGDLDAIATPHGAGGTNMQVFRNNGQGVFGIPTNYVHTPMNPYTNDLLTGDVNGDGFVDLVQLPNGGGFFVWMNDTHGTFTKTVYAEILGRDGALADFTGDGVRDLIGCTYVSANYNFRRGNGNGTFAETVTIPMQTTGRGMVAADFDGDGRMDLAQAMAESEDAVRIILDVGQCVGGGGGGGGGGAVCGNGTREGTEQCDD